MSCILATGVSDEVYHQVREYCKKNKITKYVLLQKSIEEYLERHGH